MPRVAFVVALVVVACGPEVPRRGTGVSAPSPAGTGGGDAGAPFDLVLEDAPSGRWPAGEHRPPEARGGVLPSLRSQGHRAERRLGRRRGPQGERHHSDSRAVDGRGKDLGAGRHSFGSDERTPARDPYALRVFTSVT